MYYEMIVIGNEDLRKEATDIVFLYILKFIFTVKEVQNEPYFHLALGGMMLNCLYQNEGP